MRTIKKSALVGGTVLTLMGAGVAFASWTTTGTGSGAATAGTAGSLTIAQKGATVTGLFPAGTKDVTITVTNAAQYKVKVQSVSPGTVSVDAAHSGCTASVVSTTAQTGLSDVLDVTGAGASHDYTFTVGMDNTASDACQGATFTIPFTASGVSSS